MKKIYLTSFYIISFILANSAFAHARCKLGSLISPPRNTADGLKSPPCGGVGRTSSVRNYLPGQTISVEWEETINHPGRFEIRILGSNDASLVGYTAPLVTIQDNQNGNIVSGRYHQYTAQVTLPNISCTACSLQLIQVMTENPTNPTNYYSCTDISIVTTPEKPTELKLEKRQ